MDKSNLFLYFRLLFLAFILSNNLLAQNTIQILDLSTHKPLISVNVRFKDLISNQKDYKVTNKRGEVINSARETSEVTISSMGYETILDTITPNQSKTFYLEKKSVFISQVVCTGTLTPQLQDKSIYDVKVISAKKIKQQGATNLSDVFQTQPNIRMTYDESLGSQIEMLGMDGNNVKVLIDGVPVLGRLNGNLDLGQINTENVDHVEMVEGPMSVIYGNNALAGTINIITRKTAATKTQAQVGTQLESVGKYSGNLFLLKPFGSSVLSLNASASYFDGVDFNKETRSQDWRPTTNYQLGLNYNCHKNDWTFNAKANGYYGKMLIKSDVSENYMAYDMYYYTRRFDVSAEAYKTFTENHSLKISSSYSFYDRASQEYDKDMTTLIVNRKEKETTQNLKNGNLRVAYVQNLSDLYFQGGIDLNYDYMGGPRLDATSYKSMGDYAAFINLKYKLNDKIEFQPGIRYAYNSTFHSPLVYSLNLKYDIRSNVCWRVSLAKGFRAPSLKELYYDFENANHDIHGNPDLKAEYAYNINTSWMYRPTNYFSLKLSGYYNNLKNKIDLIRNTSISNNYYDYQNIHKYESLGGNLLVEITPIRNLHLNIGATVTGRYNNYSGENDSQTFDYSPDVYGGISYFESHSKIQCSIDYKYNGKRPYFYTDSNDLIQEGKEEAYHFMNVSANRTFLNQHLKAALGIRNLFDVTDVKSVGANASVHSDSNTTSITYGRSFFVQATYNF